MLLLFIFSFTNESCILERCRNSSFCLLWCSSAPTMITTVKLATLLTNYALVSSLEYASMNCYQDDNYINTNTEFHDNIQDNYFVNGVIESDYTGLGNYQSDRKWKWRYCQQSVTSFTSLSTLPVTPYQDRMLLFFLYYLINFLFLLLIQSLIQ